MNSPTASGWGIRRQLPFITLKIVRNPKNSKIYHESTPLLKANAANYEDTKLFCSFRVFHLSCFAAYALRRDVTVFFSEGCH